MDYITLNRAKLIASQRIMDDYIKNGGAYMAQNKLLNLDEKSSGTTITNKVKNARMSVDDTKQYIKDAMVAIKSKHDPFMPKVDWSKYENELQKKEYFGPTESEIVQSAQDKYADYKKASIDKIMLDYDADKNNIDTATQKLNEDYQTDKAKLDSEVISDIEGNQQRAINQGIQDSSILNNQQLATIKDYEQNSAGLKNEYNVELNALEIKKSLVEAQKELALENFDISYANKLNSEIRRLTNEQNKIKAEIDKYNAA
ncbi:MAG: hypothetical protein IKC79_03780, partial [Clostridia bacterium]|nr:hypothetical protein [Clostridia bacterium]